MTTDLFREDAYKQNCTATVTAIDEEGRVALDRTVFYPRGGGQPGDSGRLRLADGRVVTVADTVKDARAEKGAPADRILHCLEEGATPPTIGETVEAEIDWDRRYAHMRMHSCMHLLCSIIDAPVTGGQVGAEKSRLDFDWPEVTIAKDEITDALNALVAADHPLAIETITEQELDANPTLVKTMSVQPPRGAGTIRVIRIGDTVDLQPCGGTHVGRTGEIGPVRVAKIEKKGRQNRRVVIAFDN